MNKSKIILITAAFIAIVAFTLFLINQKYLKDKETSPSDISSTPIINDSKNSIPTQFPEDFPQPIDADITSSWSASGDETVGFSVIWETEKNAQEVFDFYQKELSNKNWKTEVQNIDDESYVINFAKDKIQGFVGITVGSGGVTVISVTMGIEKG